MLVRGLWTMLVLWAAAGSAFAEEASSVHETALPATLERVTAPTPIAYIFFFVLASLAVLVVFRGIRAR